MFHSRVGFCPVTKNLTYDTGRSSNTFVTPHAGWRQKFFTLSYLIVSGGVSSWFFVTFRAQTWVWRWVIDMLESVRWLGETRVHRSRNFTSILVHVAYPRMSLIYSMISVVSFLSQTVSHWRYVHKQLFPIHNRTLWKYFICSSHDSKLYLTEITLISSFFKFLKPESVFRLRGLSKVVSPHRGCPNVRLFYRNRRHTSTPGILCWSTLRERLQLRLYYHRVPVLTLYRCSWVPTTITYVSRTLDKTRKTPTQKLVTSFKTLP